MDDARNTTGKAISRATEPAEIHALLLKWRGRENEILDQVAQYTRAWDDSLLSMVLSDSTHVALLMLDNPHRPANADERAMQWALDRIDRGWNEDWKNGPAAVLRKLAINKRLPLRGPVGQRLFDMLNPTQESVGASPSSRQWAAFSVLYYHPELTSDDLYKLYDAIHAHSNNEEALNHILRHPRLSSKIWRHLILQRERPTLAREPPRVSRRRGYLSDTGSGSVALRRQ